jgi:hypothetical protein
MSGLTTNGSHLKRRATQNRPVNGCPQCGGPITIALVKMLNDRVPNDPRRRTYAELIAEVLIREAVKGDIQAIKEMTDRVEGETSEARCNQLAGPVVFRVVHGPREPVDQKRGIDSPQPQPEHIESAKQDSSTTMAAKI